MKIESPEWLKQAFEYAALKRDSDLLGMLLEKSKEEHGIKQFLDMYGLILDFMVDRIDFRELSDRMSSLKVSSSKDLKILKDIYACVFMYYDDEFIGITKNASLIYKEIVKLGKRRAFIKEAFSYRLSEILAPAYLHLNEPKLCMFHANVLVSTELNNKHISDGNYYIGMCKLHEDKTSCLTHMEKSLHFAKETKEPLLIREATNNLNMVKSLFSFIEGGSAPVFAGEKEKFLLGGDADFVVYFNYVRNREISNVYAAYKHFFEEMNFFFASIAAETLRMFGVDDIQIDVLKSFKLKSKGDVVYEKDFIDGFCFRGTSCIAS